jgi:hypothetical protein
MSCVCIIDSDNVKVFTNEGEDYVSSLQFQVIFMFQCLLMYHLSFVFTDGVLCSVPDVTNVL